KVALAHLHAAEGRRDEAIGVLTDAIDSYTKLGCCRGPRASAMIMRAEAASAEGRLDAAMADAKSALELGQSAQGSAPYSNVTGSAWLLLGDLHRAQGRVDEAKQDYAQAATNLRATLGEEHPSTLRAKQGLLSVPVSAFAK